MWQTLVALSVAVETPDPFPHPTLAPVSAWPGVVIIVTLGLFATAALVGPIVRAIMGPPDADADPLQSNPQPIPGDEEAQTPQKRE